MVLSLQVTTRFNLLSKWIYRVVLTANTSLATLFTQVGTNHFGHFYLNHLVQSKSILQSDAHITVTASGVHDPESPGGAQGVPASLGNLQGLRDLGKAFEMIDGSSFNADKAYKDSKVCTRTRLCFS